MSIVSPEERPSSDGSISASDDVPVATVRNLGFPEMSTVSLKEGSELDGGISAEDDEPVPTVQSPGFLKVSSVSLEEGSQADNSISADDDAPVPQVQSSCIPKMSNVSLKEGSQEAQPENGVSDDDAVLVPKVQNPGFLEMSTVSLKDESQEFQSDDSISSADDGVLFPAVELPQFPQVSSTSVEEGFQAEGSQDLISDDDDAPVSEVQSPGLQEISALSLDKGSQPDDSIPAGDDVPVPGIKRISSTSVEEGSQPDHSRPDNNEASISKNQSKSLLQMSSTDSLKEGSQESQPDDNISVDGDAPDPKVQSPGQPEITTVTLDEEAHPDGCITAQDDLPDSTIQLPGISQMHSFSIDELSQSDDLSISDDVDMPIPAIQLTGLPSKMEDKTYRCCCLWSPKWTQVLLSPPFFLTCICFIVFGDAVVEGVATGTTTTIEIRYHLTATYLGILDTAFSVGNMVALPFVSYFGGRPHAKRPHWIATGALGMAVGTMLTALPQFLFEKYDAGVLLSNGEVRSLECGAQTGDDHCNNSQEVSAQNEMAYWIMFIGTVVAGVGYAAVPSLALAYIDDNCETKTTALYAGIIESMYGIGSIFGFLLSSYTLSLWVDFYHLENGSPLLSPEHPAWVGAWWIGILVCVVIFMVSSVPIYGFPASLPIESTLNDDLEMAITARILGRRKSLKIQGRKKQEVPDQTTEVESLNECATKQGPITGFFKTYCRLMKNPVLMFITLGMMCEYALLESFGNFIAKYLEAQYEISASYADLLTGVATVPPYGIGWIVGGLIVKKTELRFTGMFLVSTGCTLISLASFLVMFFLGCHNPDIAGVSVAYPGQRLSEVSVDAECNMHCDCTKASYQPVCDVTNNVMYISPCFAGCNNTLDSVTYHNCSCLESPSNSSVVAELCEFDCHMLVPFIVVLVIQTLASTMAGVPRLMLLLRFVDPADKTSALGINQVFTSLGGIVGPVIYAIFIDKSCLVWQLVCEKNGACLVYDIELYRRNFIGLSLVTGTLAVLVTFPALYFIRKTAHSQSNAPSDIDDDEHRVMTLNVLKKRNSIM